MPSIPTSYEVELELVILHLSFKKRVDLKLSIEQV